MRRVLCSGLWQLLLKYICSLTEDLEWETVTWRNGCFGRVCWTGTTSHVNHRGHSFVMLFSSGSLHLEKEQPSSQSRFFCAAEGQWCCVVWFWLKVEFCCSLVQTRERERTYSHQNQGLWKTVGICGNHVLLSLMYNTNQRLGGASSSSS